MFSTRARGSLRFPSAMLVGAPEGRGDDAGILHYIVGLADFGGYFLGHFEHTGLAGARNLGSGAARSRRCVPGVAGDGSGGSASGGDDALSRNASPHSEICRIFLAE